MEIVRQDVREFIAFNLIRTFLEFKCGFFKNGKKGQSTEEAQRVWNLCKHLEFQELRHLSEAFSEMNREKTEEYLLKNELAFNIWLQKFSGQSNETKILFHRRALEEIHNLFLKEALAENLQNSEILQISLYRCFDSLDRTLGIDYSQESSMPSDSFLSERIFAGSAESVQSSYSTIFSTLREINPKEGAKLIDLGCGFGRLGFVIGLQRPDMQFIGYEYVAHRIENAVECAKNLNIEAQIQFKTQDLSEKSFRLPIADIYYMYDPFSAETYRFILQQILEISKKQPVMIATKGNAKDWLHEISSKNDWLPVRSFDHGNLNLFQSA